MVSALSDPTNSFLNVALRHSASQTLSLDPNPRGLVALSSEMFSPSLASHVALDMHPERQQFYVVACGQALKQLGFMGWRLEVRLEYEDAVV